MARSIAFCVLHITALVGALDMFEGKFLLRSSDLLSTDPDATMPLVAKAGNRFQAALT
jgi:hypothetical protein